MELRKILEDLLERAFRTGKPYVSEFLARERVEETGVRGDFVLLGGRPDSERALFAALPSQDFRVDASDYLSALRVVPNDGGNYAHRDYLGSILALGVKRESLGDVVVGAGEAFVVTTPPMAKFIKDNLGEISRTGAKVLPVGLGEIPLVEREPERLSVSVASMRLDCLLSAIFEVSRNDAKSLCERGAVAVNRQPAGKSEKLLRLGDFVVLKGHGRFRVESEEGFSKKGKIRLSVTKEGK